jgi:hypothetical protein
MPAGCLESAGGVIGDLAFTKMRVDVEMAFHLAL